MGHKALNSYRHQQSNRYIIRIRGSTACLSASGSSHSWRCRLRIARGIHQRVLMQNHFREDFWGNAGLDSSFALPCAWQNQSAGTSPRRQSIKASVLEMGNPTRELHQRSVPQRKVRMLHSMRAFWACPSIFFAEPNPPVMQATIPGIHCFVLMLKRASSMGRTIFRPKLLGVESQSDLKFRADTREQLQLFTSFFESYLSSSM